MNNNSHPMMLRYNEHAQHLDFMHYTLGVKRNSFSAKVKYAYSEVLDLITDSVETLYTVLNVLNKKTRPSSNLAHLCEKIVKWATFYKKDVTESEEDSCVPARNILCSNTPRPDVSHTISERLAQLHTEQQFGPFRQVYLKESRIIQNGQLYMFLLLSQFVICFGTGYPQQNEQLHRSHPQKTQQLPKTMVGD